MYKPSGAQSKGAKAFLSAGLVAMGQPAFSKALRTFLGSLMVRLHPFLVCSSVFCAGGGNTSYSR